MRPTPFLTGILALVALLAVSATAGASSSLTTPAASTMALVATDFATGATVTSQGSKGSPAIPAVSYYHRGFAGVKVGSVKTLLFENEIELVANQSAAAGYVATLQRASHSAKTRKALLTQIIGSFAAKKKISKKPPTGRFVRFGKFGAGDAAAELVVQVKTDAGKILVGEIFIQRGSVLAAIDYVVLGPAVTTVAGELKLAKAQVGHIDAANAPPVVTSVPTILGAITQGYSLSASPGAWTGSPMSYAYQWERCDANGANCIAVTSATATTYAITTADTGFTLVVVVTATNAAGSATSTSAHTGIVT